MRACRWAVKVLYAVAMSARLRQSVMLSHFSFMWTETSYVISPSVRPCLTSRGDKWFCGKAYLNKGGAESAQLEYEVSGAVHNMVVCPTLVKVGEDESC